MIRRAGWALALLPGAAWSQCAMCFRNAAALEASRQQALNLGILVLLVPPFLVLAGILYLAWKRSPAPDENRGGLAHPAGGNPHQNPGQGRESGQ